MAENRKGDERHYLETSRFAWSICNAGALTKAALACKALQPTTTGGLYACQPETVWTGFGCRRQIQRSDLEAELSISGMARIP